MSDFRHWMSAVAATVDVMTDTSTYLVRTTSPIGRLEITSDGEHITSLTIEHGGSLPNDDRPENRAPVLEQAVTQLAEYFAGKRKDFDLPLDPRGTPFQVSVWERLRELDFGDHVSYGELGAMVGRPGSARAIGGAVGANPIPILIGCHRVLAANGAVTGYSGGEGVPTKLWLLAHEGITLAA
jgi:O-6-methylguanine DNA methyltransferase